MDQSLALTGKTPQQAEGIMRYLNETSDYFYRLNSKLRAVDERVVWLYAGSGGFCLFCVGNLQDAKASFGIRFSQKNKGTQ